MSLPTTPINTTHLQAATNDPNLARADLLLAVQTINTMMLNYGVPNGFAVLDAAGMLSTAYLSGDSMLTAVKTVDGPGSGLDADTLDGFQADDFIRRTGAVQWTLANTQVMARTTASGTGHAASMQFANTFGSTAAGYGLDLQFALAQSDGNLAIAGSVGMEWISATAGSATSGITFETRSLGVVETALKYYGRRLEMTETTVTPTGNPATGKWWLYFLPAGLFIKDDVGTQVQLGAGTTVDHGSLTGLTDDDHTQYLLVSGARAMTGNLLMGTNMVRFTDRAVPAAPAGGLVYLYSKGQQLFYMPSNGVEVGPLGAGGGGGGVTIHNQLSGLGANDHPHYLLRQPTADVVINDAGGDFNFRMESVGNANMVFLDAGLNSLGVGGIPIGYGSLEVRAATGFGVAAISTTQSAIYGQSTSGTTALLTGQAKVLSLQRNIGATPVVPICSMEEMGSSGFRVLDIIGKAATDTLRVQVGIVDAFRVTATNVVVNDTQDTFDFLVKGTVNSSLFRVDAANNIIRVAGSTNLGASLNVSGTSSLHCIHAITTGTNKNALYLESSIVATYAAKLVGGAFGGRGQGISVTTARDETATFVKALAGNSVQAAQAVYINVNDGSDTAHALHIVHAGTGDILRCEGPFATTNHYPFRVRSNGTTVWEYLAADPPAGQYPPAGTYALYAKAGGFYVMNSSGTVSGPLGTGTGGAGVTDHGLLDAPSLLDNDHPQYVLRQPVAPATETVINDAAGNYNFRIEGTATPNLFFLSASNNAVGINGAPSTSGRLEVTSGAGRQAIVAASTDMSALYAASTTGTTITVTGNATAISASRSVSSTPTVALVNLDELGSAGFRLLDVNGRAATDTMRVRVGTIEALRLTGSQFIINGTQSNAYDVNIKTQLLPQFFYISSGNNAMYLGAIIFGGGILNINSSGAHGIFARTTTANTYAGYFDAQGVASAWAITAVGGNISGGAGSGVQVLTVRDTSAAFTKTLGTEAVGSGYAVGITVATAIDTAHGLAMYQVGTGDFINCGTPAGTMFRLLPSGASTWAYLAAAPSNPASGAWALYFKIGGLYVKDSGGTEYGPLGTGGGGSSDHNALTNLATGLTHTQYVPYQQVAPATTTIINASAGDFDFNIRGLTNNNLFHIDAGIGAVAVNRTPGSLTLGRFQVLESGAGNTGIWVSSSAGTGLAVGSNTGTAIVAASTTGTVATFTRTATSSAGTLPVVDIAENDTTNGYIALRVTGNVTAQPLALFRHGSQDRFSIGSSETIVNDGAQSYNFRVEGTTVADLFRVQAGNNAVGINTVASTSGRLEINAGLSRYAIIAYGSDYPAIYAEAITATAIRADSPVQAFLGRRNASTVPIIAAVQIDEVGSAGFRLLDLNGRASTDVMRVKVGTLEVMSIKAASVVFNESAATYDFTIKGLTAMQLFTVTAVSDIVSINGSLATGRFNVQGGSMHGIYSLATATPTTKYAGYFEQRAADWCVRVYGGTVPADGRGAGVAVTTVRDAAGYFGKTLGGTLGALSAYAVRVQVDSTPDTAIALSIVNAGTGDYFRVEDMATIAQFRLPAGGGSIWHDQTAPITAGSTYHALYFKSDGLYINGPAGEFGPLATSTSAVGASHSLLNPASLAADDHTQYMRVDGARAMTGRLVMDANYVQLNNLAIPVAPAVGTIKLYSSGDRLFVRHNTGSYQVGEGGDLLSQPVANVVINPSQGDFDRTYRGTTTTSLLCINAGANAVGINTTAPSGSSRLEINALSSGRFGITVGSTDVSAIWATSTSGATIKLIGENKLIEGTRTVSTTPTLAMMQLDETGTAGFRVLDINGKAVTDTMRVRVGNVEALRVTAGEVVVNDTASSFDFRVEGTTLSELFHVFAGSNEVCINQFPASSTRLSITSGVGRAGVGIVAADQPAMYASTTGLMPIMWLTRVAGTTPTAAALHVEETGTTGFRLLDLNAKASTDILQVKAGGNSVFHLSATGAVFNESQLAYDFRINGVSVSPLFVVDSVANVVRVGPAASGASLNVVAGTSLHGIHVSQNTASKYGILIQAGTDANGRGPGLNVESCRDATAIFTKSLGALAAQSAYQVGIFNFVAGDTAHGILMTLAGTGDYLKLQNASGITAFGLPYNFGAVMADCAADMTTPGGGYHCLYFKADGLYVKSSAGTVFGPMIGTDTQTTSLSTGVGTVKMAGATPRDCTGWIHTNLKNGTSIRIPYWTTITG